MQTVETSGRMYRPVAYSRIVRPVSGAPRIRVILTPMKNYGEALASTTNGTNRHDDHQNHRKQHDE